MKQILSVLLIVLGLTTGYYQNTSKVDKAPNLVVTSGDDVIQCTLLQSIAGQEDINGGIFKEVLSKNSSSDIKCIKFNQEIKLDFGSMPPDKITVKDVLLKPNGDYLFTNKEILDVPLIKKDNYYTFIVNPHICSALKSQNTDDYRGFTISASWGSDEYISAFVIKEFAQ